MLFVIVVLSSYENGVIVLKVGMMVSVIEISVDGMSVVSVLWFMLCV